MLRHVNVAVSTQAPPVILRKALDAAQSQAQALLQSLPAPASPAQGKGRLVDTYA
jgi:hypothetical protein